MTINVDTKDATAGPVEQAAADHSEVEVLEAQGVAGRAVIAHLTAQLEAAQVQIANLETGLRSTRRISAAIGILMATYKLSYEQAFQLLSRISQRDHRKLRDVAEEVLLTGTVPEPRKQPPA